MSEKDDSTTVQMPHPQELAGIKRDLQDYRLRGQFISGHEYICKLPPSVRRLKLIAIDIAQLYLAQGHSIRAAEACAFSQNSIFADEDALDAESICLALVLAYVDIWTHCKMKTALLICQRVTTFGLAE